MTIRESVQNYAEAGVFKANMSVSRMFVLAVLAGMYIAFAGAASTVAAATIASPSVAKLVAALIFPAGLAMVVANGTELFTGNNLMTISLLEKKITAPAMLRNWLIVYIGNFAGSLLLAFIACRGGAYSLFSGAAAESFLSIAAAKCTLPFTDALLKGILCNVLVCAAVMMAGMGKTAPAKIAMLYLPIMMFVVCGFEHSVANMSYISTGLFLQDMSLTTIPGLNWEKFLLHNLFPVTLGNIIGGSLLGVGYWYTNLKKTA